MMLFAFAHNDAMPPPKLCEAHIISISDIIAEGNIISHESGGIIQKSPSQSDELFCELWVQFRYSPKMATIMAIIKYFSDMLSCDSVILLPFGNSDIFATAKVILYSPPKLCEAQYHLA